MHSFIARDPKGGGLRLKLYVQPGARRNEFAGLIDAELKIRVKARPEEGAANRELCEFIACSLHLSKSSVSILSGQASRHKTVFLAGDANSLIKKIEKLIEL